MVYHEIPPGTVDVFRDCPLLRKVLYSSPLPKLPLPPRHLFTHSICTSSRFERRTGLLLKTARMTYLYIFLLQPLPQICINHAWKPVYGSPPRLIFFLSIFFLTCFSCGRVSCGGMFLTQGDLGVTYLAEFLGAPVAATMVLASLASLPAIAAAELRVLTSLLPAYPRLVRSIIAPGVKRCGVGDGGYSERHPGG